MYHINLIAGWIGVLCGFIFGAITGLLFYKEDWLGGYTSWKRRLLRLSHISFFGIAIINFFFFYTCNYLHVNNAGITSLLFIIASIAMPAVCILSAVNQKFRHLFFIPVVSLIVGSSLFIITQFL